MTEITTVIDEAIANMVSSSQRSLLERWKSEYKTRVRHVLSEHCPSIPDAHSGFPGFESNLVVKLCQLLSDWCPNCERPYASYVDGSRASVDIHIARNGSPPQEAWIEVGMYASDEESKYTADFEKLCVLVDNAPSITGVLVHFEVFRRGKVGPLFQRLARERQASHNINVQTLGDETNIHVLRLVVQSRTCTGIGGNCLHKRKENTLDITDYAVPIDDHVPFAKFMAYIAQVDGDVSLGEKQAIDSVLIAWGLKEDAMKEVYSVLENGADIEEICRQFKNRKTGYLLIQELITLAYLDGSYDESERSAVSDIATYLCISTSRIAELEKWVLDGVAWRKRGLQLVTPEGE